MEKDSLVSAIREIPFRICADERKLDQNNFIKGIKAVSLIFVSIYDYAIFKSIVELDWRAFLESRL